MANMTLAQAHELTAAVRSMGVEASVQTHDYAPTNPDGTYTGEVLSRYSVRCVIRDARHGNAVVRDLSEPCDAAEVATDMAREVKERAKSTRTRIRAEREAAKS